MSGASDRNPPIATRTSVEYCLAEKQIAAPRFSPARVPAFIQEYTRDLPCKEFHILTSRMNTQDQNHQAVDRRVQDIIQDIGYLRVGFDQHSAKQHSDIQKTWANVEQLRTAVVNSSFSLNQEVELLRNTVAATAAKFEDCDRAVNAAKDELRGLASKVRSLEGISTRLFGVLKGQAAEIDRLKGIVLRLSGDPNQQSQGSTSPETRTSRDVNAITFGDEHSPRGPGVIDVAEGSADVEVGAGADTLLGAATASHLTI